MKSLSFITITTTLLLTSVSPYFFEKPRNILFMPFDYDAKTDQFSIANPVLRDRRLSIELEKAIMAYPLYRNPEITMLLSDEPNQITLAMKYEDEERNLVVSDFVGIENKEYTYGELNWDSKDVVFERLDHCSRHKAVYDLLEKYDVPGINEVLITQIVEVETFNIKLREYCSVMRNGLFTLSDYLAAIMPDTDLREVKLVLFDVLETLASLEALNIITGDLREDNIVLKKIHGKQFHKPFLNNLMYLKFVKFCDKTDDYSGINYSGIYKAPEITKRGRKILDIPLVDTDEPHPDVELNSTATSSDFGNKIKIDSSFVSRGNISVGSFTNSELENSQENSVLERMGPVVFDDTFGSEAEPQVIVHEDGYVPRVKSKKNGYESKYGDYEYSLTEDNYAFGAMVLDISKRLKRIMEDTVENYEFTDFLDKIGKQMTDEKRFLRATFFEVKECILLSLEKKRWRIRGLCKQQ